MAPKKAAPKKAAAREKAVEEKTFGMKNKKGAKGQKIVQQVQQSVNATAAKGSRGPSKKELKEIQKAQEAEMMALFNIVPKKNEEGEKEEEELDPDTGPTFTDVTQEIEYQRANVVAKTKITDAVFQEWRKKKTAERRAAEEESRKDRIKRGLLTGREIFLQSKGAGIVDDDTAAGDDDMMREIDEEEEIRRMEELSNQMQRDARIAAGMEPEEASSKAQPSGVSTVVKTATGVELSKEDQEALFDDDDDVDLDALEEQVQQGAS